MRNHKLCSDTPLCEKNINILDSPSDSHLFPLSASVWATEPGERTVPHRHC